MFYFISCIDKYDLCTNSLLQNEGFEYNDKLSADVLELQTL